MRKFFVLSSIFLASFPAYSGDIHIVGFRDALSFDRANLSVTIFLDGNKVVEEQKLPYTIETNSKKSDITICMGNTNYCDSATIYPDNSKPTEVGFFIQTLGGNLYFKTLTGGGLKVIKDKAAAAEAQAKAIEDAKRNEAKP